MKRYFLPVFIVFVILIASCYYDNEEALYPSLNSVCDTSNVTYSGTIAPILSNYCTGCHSGSVPSGSISLAGHANVQTVAASGTLMNALKGNGVSLMPPSGSLSACRIRQFQIWISNSMPNN
jgi:cytochrome c5